MSAGAHPESADALVRDLRGVFGDRLASVVLYGSEAHLPGSGPSSPRGMVYTMAVVASLTQADLAACAARAASWRAARLAAPLLLTPHDLRRSLDAFPLELGEILARHVLVYGTTPFDGLVVPVEAARGACERQVRGHALHLREGFLESGGDPRQLAQIVVASAAPLAGLLAGLARLDDQTEPAPEAGGPAAVPAGADASVFRAVEAAGRAGTISPTEAETLYPAYLNAIERLVKYVDAWQG